MDSELVRNAVTAFNAEMRKARSTVYEGDFVVTEPPKYELPEEEEFAMYFTGSGLVLKVDEYFAGFSDVYKSIGGKYDEMGDYWYFPLWRRKKVFDILAKIDLEELVPVSASGESTALEVDEEEYERILEDYEEPEEESVEVVEAPFREIPVETKERRVKVRIERELPSAVVDRIIAKRGDDISYIYFDPRDPITDYSPLNVVKSQSEEENEDRIESYREYLEIFDEQGADVASRVVSNEDYLGVSYNREARNSIIE